MFIGFQQLTIAAMLFGYFHSLRQIYEFTFRFNFLLVNIWWTLQVLENMAPYDKLKPKERLQTLIWKDKQITNLIVIQGTEDYQKALSNVH